MGTDAKAIFFLRQPLLGEHEDGDSHCDSEKCETTAQEISSDLSPEQNGDSLSFSDLSYEPRRWNRNIVLCLINTFFSFSGRAIWGQNVLSAYIYLIMGEDPKYVGFISAVMGLTSLITSFPAGILADRYRRDTMLEIASFVGLAAGFTTVYAVYEQSYPLLNAALAVFGVYWGISNTCLTALYSDSIDDGDRSYFFSLRVSVQGIGTVLGPIVTLIMFLILGDGWTIEECSIVIYAGLCVLVPAFLLSCFYKDMNLVSHKDGDDEDDDNSFKSENSESSNKKCSIAYITEDESIASINYEDVDLNERRKSARLLCIPGHRVVPTFVVSADILAGLASGMSMRYFSIFFINNLEISPSKVQIVFIVNGILMVIGTRTAQRIGLKIGRTHTAILFKWMGVAMLLSMVLSYYYKLPNQVICTFFVLRTAFLNSTGALTRSVVMDQVPQNERGKWAALEAVNLFGWTGSAFIGGLFVDWQGVVFTFLFSSILQIVATIPLFIVRSRVPKERNG